MTNTLSTSGFYSSNVYNMNTLQSQIDTLQTQISTGNQFSSSTQDPLGASQMRSLQGSDALATADTANSNAAATSLSLADSTLSQVTNVVTQIQTLAEEAANGTESDSDRADIGTQISALQSQLVSLANTKDTNGNSIFGGTGSGDAYTADSSGNVTYNGTASANTVSIGAGMSVSTGVTGSQVFTITNADGTTSNLLDVVANLASALQAGTSSDGTTAQSAASNALTQLSAGLTQVTSAQTIIGASENWVTTAKNISTSLSTQRSTSESDVGATDLTTAVSKLQQTMTVLEAAQSTFVKVSGMSLFSMLDS